MSQSPHDTDLSAAARALLLRTRDCYEPTGENRAHVQWRVEQSLVAATRSGGRATAFGTSRRRWPGLALAAVVLGLAGLSAAAVVTAISTRDRREPSPPAHRRRNGTGPFDPSVSRDTPGVR